MVANGVSRGRPGRTPQFLTLGLLVVICILAFNYWNVSSRSRLLQRQVQEMTATLEELAMKKVHLEKRSEALQSQIGDANKVNTILKTEKESCIKDKEDVQALKEEVGFQAESLRKEKDLAVTSLAQFRINASKTVELLMDMKTKYETLRTEHEQIQEASRREGQEKEQAIQAIQQNANNRLEICESQKQELNRIVNNLQKEFSVMQQQRGGQQVVQGNEQAAYNQQQQLLQQQQQQQQQQEQQQQLQEQQQQLQNQQGLQQQNGLNAQQLAWMQREQYRQQQQKQQQQQPEQQDQQQKHMLYDQQYQQQQQEQNEQQAQEEQRQEGEQQMEKPGQADPGPVQMEANQETKKEEVQQPQMFPDREQQPENQQVQGPGPDQGQVDREANDIDNEQGPGPAKQENNKEEVQQQDEEDSQLSDVEDERENQINQGQVQAPQPVGNDKGGDEDQAGESSLSEVGKVEEGDNVKGEIVLQEEDDVVDDERLEVGNIDPGQQGVQMDPNPQIQDMGAVRVVDDGKELDEEERIQEEINNRIEEGDDQY